MDGILIVNKEKKYTSRDVVNILSKELNTKKIGHTGTLDPDAQGVLPVCLGKATKVCDLLTDKDKAFFERVTMDMSEVDATFAIHQLSNFLCRYYGKKADNPP